MASSCKHPGCKVPADPGLPFCILHDAWPKDVGRFRGALFAQIGEGGPSEGRNERYSFKGYIFPTSVAVGYAEEPVGSVIRIPAITGNVSFDGARIMGGASFDGATIGGDVSFEGARIDGRTSFIKTTIEGDAIFTGATINGDVSFNGTTIEKSASFEALTCRRLLIGIDKPHIRGWGHDRCGVVIRDPDAAISFWHFAQKSCSKQGEREKADAAFYFERLNRWRILRRIKADDGEPWMRRLWQNWVIRPGYWLLFLLDLFLVRWTTAYGASLARLFTTWFIVISGFGIAFSLNPVFIGQRGSAIGALRTWINGLHYSVTTFATLGLGDLSPGESALGKVLTSIEALLGAVLIALAVLVLGRRFMRQG